MKKAAKLTSAFLSLLLGASPLLTTTIPAVANEARAGQDDALTGEVIDVTEYGADPSGYKDSSPAIIEAIAAAKEKTDAGESVTLSFPKGEYNFYPDKATKKLLYLSNTTGANTSASQRTIGICIEDMQNVTIDGNGSRFVYHGKIKL